MPSARLADRAVLRVSGAEARGFLQGLVTCDMDRVGPGQAAFGGLLTPQGKILVDFLVAGDADGAFLVDVPSAQAADLLKRLTMYRLRAKVAIEARPDLVIRAGWDAPESASAHLAFADPRAAGLGWRAFVPAALDDGAGEAADYHAHRVALGVPDGGRDYAYGDTFPHDANFDLLHGVDFGKGCYVGQEVVSRVQHRGSARKRIVKLRVLAGRATPGDNVSAGDTALGTLGSVAGDQALALLRVDKLQEALAAGTSLRSDGADIAEIALAQDL